LESPGTPPGASKISTALALVAILGVAAVGAYALYFWSSHSVRQGHGSGPISTFPAVWIDVCGLPVHGNTSTRDNVLSQFLPGVAKFSLRHVYASIVGSESFKQVSAGKGWVTAEWDLSSNGGSYMIQALFVLVSGSVPSGFVRAFYDLGNGNVTASYESNLISSCPARITSSAGGTLDRNSPAYYPRGVPVGITFGVADDAIPGMVVSSPSSCLAGFVVRIGDPQGQVVYDSTSHPGCNGPPLHFVLNPGLNFSQKLAWNQTDDSGKQVPDGVYEVMGNWMGNAGGSNGPLGKVYFGTPVSVTPQEFVHNFGFGLNTPQIFYSPGQIVKINEGLGNNGNTIADIQTTQCTFTFKIFNLTEALVYDSVKHQACSGPAVDDPLAPEGGGIGQTSSWNQTDDSGRPVPPGLYHIAGEIRVWSGGHAFNATQRTDFVIGSSSPQPDMIGIFASSICDALCGGPGPSFSSTVDFNGNLTSLTLYLNGVDIATRTYSTPCNMFTCETSFDTPIDNQTVPVFPGGSYEIAFVGKFQDGNSSISWANPLVQRS
jgi:hypothetical protein